MRGGKHCDKQATLKEEVGEGSLIMGYSSEVQNREVAGDMKTR